MVKRSVVIGAGVLALFALASIRASADVKLPNLISSKMVLQRDVPVTIWGWADEGERVTVSIAGQTHATTAENGKWAVTLAPMKAGGPEIMTISGKNTITLKDILIGEVWVCSGQSNMQWALSQTDEAEKHIAAATNPKIRLYYVARTRSDSPLSETSGTWELCTPKTVPGFSAVAYFFGRELQKAIKAPVGVIHSSWGGSPAEAWTKESVLAANPQFKANILDSYERSIEQFKKALAQEKAKAAKAKKGQKAAAPPRAPWKPGELYNGMIAPLLPYAIKGAIWYQGESNAARAAEYRKLMPTMIQNWRQDWGLGDFPFLIVQLAPYLAIKEEPSESTWAELREAQSLTAKVLPNVGLAVITDVGDPKDIHPKKKEPVGARLALAARAIAYGHNIECSGPTYRDMEIRGNKIILHFDHVGRGLVAKEGPLKGFAIAGSDGKFVWAKAEIDGKTIVVSSPNVPRPVAARYGWADCPVVNLWNKNGLPASPFRTDRSPSDLSY